MQGQTAQLRLHSTATVMERDQQWPSLKLANTYLVHTLTCLGIVSIVRPSNRQEPDKIQNRAGRVIAGSSYDVRSGDVLNNWKWKTLETRRFHTKVTLMYKIFMIYLPPSSSPPQQSSSFVKLNHSNINYNVRNIETDLALPRPYKNFLRRSFKYSGAMLWNNLFYEAKTAQSVSDFKHKLASWPSMPSTQDRTDSM